MNEPRTPDVIRITREDAASERVDDLLKRQMSMRGEPGVTRDRRTKWYYQNWLVFMIAGTLGAVLAWAILEPFFDDELYVQGRISEWNPGDSLPEFIEDGGEGIRLQGGATGSLRINGDQIYLVDAAREILPDGSVGPFDRTALHEGETIGVYVRYWNGTRRDLALAANVVLHPDPNPPAKASLRLSELAARSRSAGLLLFPLVAGMIGLLIGAVDGLVCRLPRRALVSGLVGLLVGAAGGFACGIFANLVYAPLNSLAAAQMAQGHFHGAFGFIVQMVARALAWGVAGMAMGLGQGIALRSGRLLLYGLLGGIVGGLFGGVLFDPIDLILLGGDRPSAHLSRLIGLAVIGGSVGGMIGLVELLARDAWLRMTQGPLTGKEFLLFKDVMHIGSSPRSDVYLFNDPLVLKQHASIRTLGDECEIEATEKTAAVLVNNRPVQRSRLRHGDNISVGRTSFVFQRRKG